MTASADTKPRTMASAWKSPAATYYLLAASAGILLIVGLAEVLSSSSIQSLKQTDGNPYALFFVQLAAFCVGFVALVFGSRLPVVAWKRLAPPILFSSIGLLVLVAVAGKTVGGNRNWIKIGGLATFQPSEIAKLGLALYLGMVLSTFRKQLTTWKQVMVPGGIMSAIVIGLVLYGRDMGTAIVLVIIVCAAYWIAGLPVRFFAMGGLFGLVGVIALLAQGTSRTGRIAAWLHPATCDIKDACMQSVHGMWALASGGLWGLGPGMSREKWGGGLPVPDSDFIFAIIGEEFGLIGTLLVLFAFAMMIVAVNRIVHRARDPFVQIAGGAIGAWLIGQACINIAVVIGLLPVTGLPLPLVSSGGSSLIASMAAVGVLMAFARAEPGAPEAFAARPSVVRRSITVLSRGRRG